VKLTIYRKIMLGFGLIIVAMVFAIAGMLYELHAVSDSVRTTLTVNLFSIDLAKDLGALLDNEEQHAQKFLVSHDTTYAGLFTEAAGRFGKQMDSLAGVVADRSELALLRTMGGTHDRLAASVLAAMNGGRSRTSVTEESVADTIDTLRAQLETLIRLNQNSVAVAMADLQETVPRTFNVAVLLTMGTIVVTVLLALFIARTITRPIRALQAGTERVAQGHFEPIRVTSHDETALLAGAFNAMSEKLRQINEYKAEMMHHITHELRMPLQSMHSAYYLLTEQLSGPINDQQKKLLESMRENIDRISGFTNQFLDLAKIEAGMMEFRRERTDIPELVRPVVENARLMAARKEITITVQEEKVPAVMGDREKLSQVVGNLLSNAIKYTDRGGSITLALRASQAGVEIAVSDNGVGIDPEDIPRLFTKFYQAKNVGKGSSKGTGVGLALVKGIVDGHRGKVSVTSRVGQGSTFTVEIPAAEDVPEVTEEKPL
jgi:signal transduction histidine kinase